MELIPAQYYQDIYLILVTILSLVCFKKYATYGEWNFFNGKSEKVSGIVLLTVFLVLFVGLRPISGKYFVDMANYNNHYHALADPNYQWTWDADNKIFDNVFYLMAGNYIDIYWFFVFMSLTNFASTTVACSMLFPNDKMAAFLVCLGAFSTFSYATNGLKAGTAAALFLIALAFNERGNKLWTWIFILLSWGFHHSMQLPVAAFVVCKFVNNPKYFLGFWFFSLLMAVFHVTFFMGIFEGMTDEQGAGYLAGATETYRGFRFDFVLYSAVPIAIGYIARHKKLIVSRNYDFLLNLYTLVNAIWLLCMYAEFTNRIVYLSWFLLPVVLIYPLLKERWGYNQYIVFRGVAYGHLCFTLFMLYIYYGFIHSLIR